MTAASAPTSSSSTPPAASQPCVARDLTPGDHDVPPFSLGGQDQYQFSPDGREIAFTSNLDEVQATSTNSDVFTLSLTVPNARPVNLTAANHGSDSTPLYSPDGKYLAIRSQFRAGYESDRFRLQTHRAPTNKITNLTENFDRWVESVAWAPDSSTLYFTAEDAGESPIYRHPGLRRRAPAKSSAAIMTRPPPPPTARPWSLPAAPSAIPPSCSPSPHRRPAAIPASALAKFRKPR